MSTTFYVWYPNLLQGGNNVGHAAIKVGTTYMSWWPYAGSKMEILKGLVGTGSSFGTPSYADDRQSEGKEPDYIEDHFGWDDGKAIAYWNSQLPTYVAALGEIVRAGRQPAINSSHQTAPPWSSISSEPVEPSMDSLP